MATSIDLDDELFGPSGSFLPTEEIPRITPEEENLLKRMHHLPEYLSSNGLSIDLPQPIAAHPPAGDSTEIKTGSAAAPILFPNTALEFIKFGLEVERSYNQKLHEHANEAKEIQQTIATLIDLSGKFAVHMEGNGERALSEEIQSLCQDLKKNGIEILQGNEMKMSRERMAEIKAHISSHTDRLKTDLQKKFTTEIQVKINELHSILECLKTIEKYASRLNATIVSNQRAR